MSTGMRKWMEKDCPEIEYPPAQVLIDRKELKQLRDRLEAAERRAEMLHRLLNAKQRDHAVIQEQNSALRAKIEQMERQVPVGKFIQHPSNGIWEQDGYGDNPDARPLYALPGAKGE